MLDAGMNCSERGKQPAPSIVATFENLFPLLVGTFSEHFTQGADGVVLVIQRVTQKKQATF